MQHRLNDNHDDAIHYINSLLKTPTTDEMNDIYWLPTPQSSRNEREHAPIQARIFNELRELMKSEQTNPQHNMNSKTQFWSKFNWTDSTLEPEATRAVETLLIEFHNIFARHRFDIGNNTEFKVQLAPLDNRSASSQRLPALINFIDDILVELSLLQNMALSQHFLSANVQVQFSHRGNQMKIYPSWLSYEN